MKARKGGDVPSTEDVTVHLDRHTRDHLGTVADLSGLALEEVARLLLEQAISEGIDRMITDPPEPIDYEWTD